MMKHIHIKTDVITIRAYADGCSYHNKDEFIGIVTGHVMKDDEIYLTGAHGDFGKAAIKLMFKRLKKMGFKIIRMERHNKMVKHIL